MNNKFQTSLAREQQANFILKNSGFAKVTLLLNEYHSIDLLTAFTEEEKSWAKSRLMKEIQDESKELTLNNQKLIRKALHSRKNWDSIRNSL